MKKLLCSLVAVAMMGMASLLSAEEAEKAALCEKCGQVQGSEICCKAEAVKCAECGKDEGSPGCCKNAEKVPEEGDAGNEKPKDHPAH